MIDAPILTRSLIFCFFFFFILWYFDATTRFVHLTNASVQKKHPDYKAKHKDSLWSFKRLEAALVEQGLCGAGWATDRKGGLQMAMKRIAVDCLAAARGKLQRKEGYFDLFGMVSILSVE